MVKQHDASKYNDKIGSALLYISNTCLTPNMSFALVPVKCDDASWMSSYPNKLLLVYQRKFTGNVASCIYEGIRIAFPSSRVQASIPCLHATSCLHSLVDHPTYPTANRLCSNPKTPWMRED